MRYKVGTIEYSYDEKELHGAVITENRTYVRENPYELLNIFINEIEGRLRRDIQNRLEGTGLNKYTGLPSGSAPEDLDSNNILHNL